MIENSTKTKTNHVTFKHKERVLCEYRPFQGYAEIVETIKLLAFEKGINEKEITAEVVVE